MCGKSSAQDVESLFRSDLSYVGVSGSLVGVTEDSLAMQQTAAARRCCTHFTPTYPERISPRSGLVARCPVRLWLVSAKVTEKRTTAPAVSCL